MLKNIIITLVSLIVTAYLVLFSDLSTAFIDKTTAYNIDLVFKSNFPKLRTPFLLLLIPDKKKSPRCSWNLLI